MNEKNPFADTAPGPSDPYALNPYESPTTSDFESKPPQLTEPVIASQGKRFVNFIIDSIIGRIFGEAAAFFMALVYTMMVIPNREFTPEDETFVGVAAWFVAVFTMIAYFIGMEFAFQRTVGKLLTGTKVVQPNGEKPTFMQIVGRSFSRLIPFEAFTFLGGKQPVGLHDHLSKTRVIDVNKSR